LSSEKKGILNITGLLTLFYHRFNGISVQKHCWTAVMLLKVCGLEDENSPQ
jgi:hypothetical protein